MFQVKIAEAVNYFYTDTRSFFVIPPAQKPLEKDIFNHTG